MTTVTVTLHQTLSTFMIRSREILFITLKFQTVCGKFQNIIYIQ